MYHPISTVEGRSYDIFGVPPLRNTFISPDKPVVMESNEHRSNLNINSKFRLDQLPTIPVNHPDPNPLPAPVVNSVWLEQGEYFFDDEFAVPFDSNVVDACGRVSPSCMTQSLDVDGSTTHARFHVDQFQSDSCLFTPGDSGESGLASAQTEKNQSSGDSDQTQLKKESNRIARLGQTNVYANRNGSSNVLVSDFPHTVNQVKTDSSFGAKQNGVLDSDPVPGNAVIRGTSVTGSQVSGQSGSTSWMQMVMERSCNPHLKALLERAEATVDYKLAYGETFPVDCSLTSSIRQLTDERLPLYDTVACGLSRSLSQGNLLTAASLAGLRHALAQAAQHLPKNAVAEVRSVGVTAELNSGGDSGPPTGTSSCAEVNTSNTTTWAQKHGSRESLKRKAKKSSDGRIGQSPTCTPQVSKPSDEVTNPWREMKKASGTLITWNQLKRTIKGNHSGLDRATTFRESRKEQHQNATAKDNAEGTTNQKVSAEGGTSVRSRSQPVSNGYYMHRFSGTLLEIFMRAKAEEMTFLTNLEDDSGATRSHAISVDHGFDVPLNLPSRDNMDLPTGNLFPGKNDKPSAMDLNSRSEAEKHPLLRGDRILPQKWHPNVSPITTDKTKQRCVCHFGAQFPPPSSSEEVVTTNSGDLPPSSQSPDCTPIWSNGLPIRRTNAAVRTGPFLLNRHSHPRNPVPYRPTSFGCNKTINSRRLYDQVREGQYSPETQLGIATCLTASAGPDSPYMAALREDYVADGYSPGWLGNPRASIAYPGLGLLSIPRPSRLTSASFLSHTLPDLSFLTQAAEEEERKGTPTMPKRLANCRCLSRDLTEHCCARCGCRSLSVGRAQKSRHEQKVINMKSTRKTESDAPTGSGESTEDNGTKPSMRPHIPRTSDPSPVIPDLVMGHKTVYPLSQTGQCTVTGEKNKPDGSLCRIDRSTSEPDLNTAVLKSTDQSAYCDSTAGGSHNRPNTLMTSSTQECYDWDSYKSSENGLFHSSSRPKKSVSFSGKIRLHRLQGLAGKDAEDHSPASPEPRLIPRNWGLYGQETPLAEFNTRTSPGRDTLNGNELAQQSDVDIRYHDCGSKHRAMVNDVIKAVQEMVAYLSNTTTSKTHNSYRRGKTQEPLPFSVVAALGSTGHQPLLSVIAPLTVLLSDGLLPPTKPLFMIKPRTRLWQMVEESCRPSPHLTGVTYRTLSDAVSQVKALTNVTLEKAKFKAFLCACLNAKALPLWLNAVVANEPLLRRFYCEDAFVRQCRSSQRGLHADLMTHLEQLLAFPFNLDLAMEARKPLVDPSSIPKSNAATGDSNEQQRHQTVNNINVTTNGEAPCSAGHNDKPISKPAVPPAVLMSRKQPLHTTGVTANRTRFSPPPMPTASSQNPTIHHYPQHHLPGQRQSTTSTRVAVPTRPSRLSGNPRASEESGVSSASSEPHSVNDAKANRFRNANGGVNSTNESSRGRLKTALSTLRRTTPTSSNLSSSKLSGTIDTSPVASKNRIGQTHMSDSQTTRHNLTDHSRPRPAASANSKVASKLKQPSYVVGRR